MTEKDYDTYKFITAYMEENGHPPTAEEMDVINFRERKQSEENKEQIKQDLIDELIDKLSRDQIISVCELFDDVAKPYIVSKRRA